MTTIPCNALWPHTARGTVEVVPSHNAGYIILAIYAGPANYAKVLVKEEDWRILATPEVQKANGDVPLPQTPSIPPHLQQDAPPRPGAAASGHASG